MRPFARYRHQQGFTYMIALFLVAILSVASLSALERALTKDRREKEKQLLFAGQAYRQAIMQYYQNSNQFPTRISDLLDAPNTSTLKRYLRRLYWDPMTGGPFDALTNEAGGIVGVASSSTQQPIKTGYFPPELSNFNCAKTYQQWQFIYVPGASQQPQNPTIPNEENAKCK